MPIIEYKCSDCFEVFEEIHLTQMVSRFSVCPRCNGLGDKMMSTPARIHMADMEKINRKRQRIKEPMWRDLKTGKLTPVNP